MTRLLAVLLPLAAVHFTAAHPRASAQDSGAGGSLMPYSLPACAQTCTILLQAQAACPAKGIAGAQQCFCTSQQLAALRPPNGEKATTPSPNICAGQCPDSDFAHIADWYHGYCGESASSSSSAAATGSSSTTATGTATTTHAAATTTSVAAAGAAAASSTSSITSGQAVTSDTPWMSTHWRWVVMVIVLIVGFTIIGLGGTLYYRRRLRGRNAQLLATLPKVPEKAGSSSAGSAVGGSQDSSNGGSTHNRLVAGHVSQAARRLSQRLSSAGSRRASSSQMCRLSQQQAVAADLGAWAAGQRSVHDVAESHAHLSYAPAETGNSSLHRGSFGGRAVRRTSSTGALHHANSFDGSISVLSADRDVGVSVVPAAVPEEDHETSPRKVVADGPPQLPSPIPRDMTDIHPAFRGFNGKSLIAALADDDDDDASHYDSPIPSPSVSPAPQTASGTNLLASAHGESGPSTLNSSLRRERSERRSSKLQKRESRS